MGGVQVTVSWSTDGLVTVMFPTGPGEAGEEGGKGVCVWGGGGGGKEGVLMGGINHTSFTTHEGRGQTWVLPPQNIGQTNASKLKSVLHMWHR